MRVLDVTPSMTVADVGAGAGAMTIVTARWLGPRGRVYSTDINETQVRAIADQVTHAGLTNVVTVVGADASTNLPDGCCDAIWLRDVYHHLEGPDRDRSQPTCRAEARRTGGDRRFRTGAGLATSTWRARKPDGTRHLAGDRRARVDRGRPDAQSMPIATWPEGPPPGDGFLVLFKKL